MDELIDKLRWLSVAITIPYNVRGDIDKRYAKVASDAADAIEKLTAQISSCISVDEGSHELRKMDDRDTGVWLPDYESNNKKSWVCSKCYSPLKVDMEDGVPTWRYCPRCGRLMHQMVARNEERINADDLS